MPAWLAFVLIVAALLLVAWAAAAWPWKRPPRRLREHGPLRSIGLLMLVGGAVVLFRGAWGDTGANLGAEAIGIGLTVLLIDYFIEKRDELRDKRYWTRELGADDPSDTKRAIRELRYQEWLVDGSLAGASLEEANFTGADLVGANLEGVILAVANLKRADLRKANLKRANVAGAALRRADLRQANLEGADLRRAYLEGADLRRADLKGADLWKAKLEGVDLTDANLEGADLMGAELTQAQIDSACGDAETKLPEGLRRPEHWV